MKRRLLLPGPLLIAVVVYAVVLSSVVIGLAHRQPWLGLGLAYDEELDAAVVRSATGPAEAIPVGAALTDISAGTDRMRLEARDFIPETDGVLETYDVYDAFRRRQSALAEIQAAPEVVFTDNEGREWRVKPEAGRPLADLPVAFWVQLAVGVIAWLIAGGVWVFRRDDLSAWYLLLSGWSTAVFSPMAGIYSTRELAMPGGLFGVLSDLNFMGGSIFAGTLVALLLCYPRQVGPRWIGVAAVGAQLAWFAAQQAGVFESMIFARRMLVMVALAATFGLSWWQWRLTRRDPVGRAALRWFLLSWVVGSGVFCMLILMPQMFGIDTSAVQGYAFLLFVLVYVGLAFGILRYRLFGLDEWWARIMTWMGALALLVVLDLLFLLQLQLSSGMSLSLSLLLCGLVWLPLRGYMSNRFLGRAKTDSANVFKAVVDVALTPRADEREVLWRKCLQEKFDPLRIEPAEGCTEDTVIEDSGLALVVPATGDIGALRMEYARGGRALFTAKDVQAAGELTGMLRHVIESRTSYEQGVKVERGRIARDIHDNIGAQLLSALHSREENKREEVLRGALADLRGIINDASNPDLSVEEALGDLRYETAGRLSAGGVELDWCVEDTAGAGGLPAKVLHVLRPLVREAASNILKHAGAKNVRVRIRREAQELVVSVEDDGKGFDPAAVRRGNGLANMEARLAAVGGRAGWTAGADGTGAKVGFHFPL
jgi:two-component system, NarL family, sensor histidine kinase DevS